MIVASKCHDGNIGNTGEISSADVLILMFILLFNKWGWWFVQDTLWHQQKKMLNKVFKKKYIREINQMTFIYMLFILRNWKLRKPRN